MNWKWFILFLIAAILGTVAIGIWHPASAYPYVQQGENITLGGTYDLTGVYGWTGKLGWWKHYYDEASGITPDVVVDLNDYKIESVYLEPAIWKTGNWYQWDGTGTESHGNTFVFKVNNTGNIAKPATTKTTVPTPTKTPRIETPTPAPTPIPTAPTPTPSPPFPKPGLPLSPFIGIVGVIAAILIWRK